MGMAASQVRLLALTDRLHDIELKSQQILAQKLALGTQKDALYNDYCDALEATNYMVAFTNSDGSKAYNDANFTNMCTFDPNRTNNYALIDMDGNVIVSKKEGDTYEKYSNDKYAFAWAMMGLEKGFGHSDTAGSLGGADLGLNRTALNNTDTTYLSGLSTKTTGPLSTFELELIDSYNRRVGEKNAIDLKGYNTALEEYNNAPTEEKSAKEAALFEAASAIRSANADRVNKEMLPQNLTGTNGNNCLMTEAELLYFMDLPEDERNGLQKYIDAINEEGLSYEDQHVAYENFREALYEKTSSLRGVYNKMAALSGLDEEDMAFNQKEFNFYVQRWEAIDEAGGWSEIDPRYESGADGREYLENMLKSGCMTVQQYNKNTGEWEDTSVATSTSGNYLIEQQDKEGLQAAEARYEHELDIIDRKETKMDNELAKLETERKAITTELDSLKTVRDDNIDRTFGIFG